MATAPYNLSTASSRSSMKLRSACDNCHHGKTKCSGGQPCNACSEAGIRCVYSMSNKLGRPKGSKNKQTLERNNAHARNSCGDMQQQPPQPRQLNTPLSNSENDPTFENLIAATPVNDYIDQRISPSLSSVDSWDVFGGFEFNMGHRESSTALPNTQTHSHSHDVPGYVSSLFSEIGTSGIETSNFSGGRPFRGQQADQSPASSEIQNITAEIPTPSQLVPSACSCVIQHIKLLDQIEDLGQVRAHLSLDIILIALRRATETWNNLIQCRKCQQTENQGVFLLFAMSIRTLLRSLKLSSLNNEKNRSSSGSISPPSISQPSWTDQRVVVGKYHATEDECRLVSHTLIMLAVYRIELAVKYLKRKINTCRCTLQGCLPNDSERLGLGGFSLFESLNEEGYRTLFSIANFDNHVESLLRDLGGIIRGMRNDAGDVISNN
ncbi:hypothetical protein F5884DRAFT_82671 [Xylogone sp. PMI_703]|nr:hypothetical protein F5884DRAFT_82671 [Xylogone sp. PMI_703]